MVKPQLPPLFLPILFFFLLSLTFQSAFSSKLLADRKPVDVKKIVLAELVKVVGLPNRAPGGENVEWTLKSVEFIMDKMNWKFDLRRHETDLEYIEHALKMIVTALNWLLDDPELDPYRFLASKD